MTPHRPRPFALAAFAVLMHWQAVYAQTLTVTPTAAKQGEPIVATLTDLPEINDVSTRTVEWSSDLDLEKQTRTANATTKYVWAAGGKHWMAATINTEVMESRDILVPGPNWANDKADVKLEKLVYLVDKTSVQLRAEFNVDGKPPEPDPGPDPPPPDPDVVPIPENGLHVLVIYESGENVPESQLQTIYSTSLRSYVAENGGEFRCYDADVTPEVAWAAKAIKRPRQSLPWWIYSNGKSGGEGPLPDEKTALETLKKLGG